MERFCLNFRSSTFRLLGKGGCTIAKNNYQKAAALLVSGKEAYGSQKQAINISLTLETIKNELFDVRKVQSSID